MTIEIQSIDLSKWLDNSNVSCTNYPEVIELYWSAGELDSQILTKFPNLRILRCDFNNLSTLAPLSCCTNLQYLNCSVNNIHSLDPLINCTKLINLKCSNNSIISLDPLSHCTKLENLDCSDNQIFSLEPISSLINLRFLDCSYNNIDSLESISSLINIHTLTCRANVITSLLPISGFVNLQSLSCGLNRITSLQPLSQCLNLHTIFCCYNQITSLSPLIYLPRLIHLSVLHNPLEPPSIQVERYLNRLENINTNISIYRDNQNVHDTHIQKTVCESIQTILRDPKPEFQLDHLIQSNLNPKVISLLMEYFQDDTVHSIHLITFKELFCYVWQRMMKHPSKLELIRILEEQIVDSECKCFTGRFNRILSVLVGFYDDIKIEISDKSRIGAIILSIKEKIIPYDPIIHREMAIKALVKVGYSENEIKFWIDAIE